MSKSPFLDPLHGVAIIGLAGRFPGAPTPAAFWENLKRGVESVDFFTRAELACAGVATELLDDPNYVRARSTLRDVDLFDAAFFGYTPHEAAHMDPQQRVFLETAWEALEDAGCDPARCEGAIGLFAGSYLDTYLLANLCTSREFIDGLLSFKRVGAFQTFLGNDKDYLTTRAAYKLNLNGPAVTVQTACSTSLVAVSMACQSLLTCQSDVAIAGGVTITFPQKKGYLYQEGGMLSPDGHCRAFDARAQGTVFGSGIGLVVLKRLADAVADRDHIYAVIKGAALNNDGGDKVSYTAPSVNGQAAAIVTAQTLAGISPDTISYVEAHGTGTPLGDPIEIAALTQAFRTGTQRKQFCAIGSVKTNVGHLDVAAGVAGLIKTAMALEHRQIPRSLHFEQPNPKIDFANSPFYVNATLAEWPAGDTPRRAAVSSFGVGGTNAHVILEEAPAVAASSPAEPWQLLVLSARSDAALDRAGSRLREHLAQKPDLNLADVAYTLQTGRREFDHRRMLVCRDTADAIGLLETRDARRVANRTQDQRNPPLVFMFPGQGAQYVGMGAGLRAREPVFRAALDRCTEILGPELGADIRDVLYPASGDAASAEAQLRQTRFTQPAIFTIEYALAQLWLAWGIRPAVMIGHSLGEYVAACLAGVFTLEDALRLVARRAALVQARPAGAMLGIRLSEAGLRPLLGPRLDLAAVNARDVCVVAGPDDAIAEFEALLRERGVGSKRLATSHAFHSAMMEPAVEAFRAEVAKVPLQPPAIPCVSNLTGRPLSASEATDPAYWANHLRLPVRLADGIGGVLQDPDVVLLEVGPGQTLSALARQNAGRTIERTILCSLGGPGEPEPSAMLGALGRLWLAGAMPNWEATHAPEERRRVPLPTYPFERKRYFIDPPSHATAESTFQTPPVAANGNVVPAPVPPLLDQPTTSPPISAMNIPATALPAPSGRREYIVAELRNLFRDLAGVDVAEADRGRSFLELGFDSLFLTQARQSFHAKFNVNITYRQLVEDLDSIDALAEHIDQQLPADAMPAPAAAAQPPVESAASTQTSASGPLEVTLRAQVGTAPASGATNVAGLMEQQVQAMSQLFAQQLAALRGAPAPGGMGVPPMITGGTPVPPAPAAVAVVPTESRQMAGAATTEPLSAAAGSAGSADVAPKPFGPYRPPPKKRGESLSSRQREFLHAFTARYTRRTAGSKRFAQETRRFVADPRSIANFRQGWKELVYQFTMQRSEGAHLWDVDGNRYLDITMGFGVNLLGHRPACVMEAVADQLRDGIHIGPQSPLVGEVASLIRESTGMERVTFCNTGSEAVMAALRVARTVTQRNKIVYFSGDYHGLFDEVLLRPQPGANPPRSVPVAPGIPPKAGEDVWILEYGAAAALDIIRAHGRELAAVLIEPVQSRNPMLQPREFLHELRKITQESGTILIADEIITGFRVHPRGAQGIFGIESDLATYGKVIGGGLPIGVLAGRGACLDALDGGFWEYGNDSGPEADVTFFAGTFVRHPLALAAARATLRHLKAGGPALQEELNGRTETLVHRLNAVFTAAAVPIAVHHFGSLFRFHFPAELPQATLLVYGLLERGIFIRETHQNCFLSTAHTDGDVDVIVSAVEDAVAELQAAEFLPGGGSRIAVPAAAAEVRAPAGEPVSYALTDAQREIWLACQLGDAVSCAYNESFTLTLRGALASKALHAALQDVVERHEALRLTFAADGSTQHAALSLQLDVPLEDWSVLDADARRVKVAAIPTEESARAFDLVQGPLVRARLCRLADDHHLLVFTAHHLVCDGWSSGVVLDELSQIYSARTAGGAPALAPAMSFADFVRAEEERRRDSAFTATERYWLEQFRELPPALDLPTDFTRVAQTVNHGGVHRAVLDAGLCAALKRTAAAQGCTMFTALLAAFKVLLRRLSGQNDVVVGVFTAGQPIAGRPDLVGHCVNMLPIRTRADSAAEFTAFLKEVNRHVLDAREHGDFTYGRLVQQLKMARTPGRAPLLGAIFNLERKGEERLGFVGLQADVDQNPHGCVNFDLFLNLRESTSGIAIDLEYNEALFAAGTVSRWVGHLETLLRSIVAEPHRSIAHLPLMREAERRQIVVEWNDTQMEYPREGCLHTLFEMQAAANPHRVALVADGERLTYQQLDNAANAVAARLRDSGVTPEARVGICMKRTWQMVAATLGVLKAGGAYVPLDPAYPRERLAFIFNDAALHTLLTESSLLATLEESVRTGTRVVCLDGEWPPGPTASAAHPATAARAEHLAYVIYTSGSTGRPKGVAIEHRNAVAFVHWAGRVFQPGELDGVLASTSICFDLSIFELFVPLSFGGKVVLAENALALADLPAADEVRLINTVPSAIQELLRLGAISASVQTVNLAGEPLAADVVQRLYALPHIKRVYDLYGPTETTTYSTFALRRADGPVTVGRPIANTRVYLLDGHGEPVPVGVAGEIHIGGDGLARGYLNRSKLTAERFVPDLFNDTGAGAATAADSDGQAGAGRSGERHAPASVDRCRRLYRSGDLARYRADGSIELLGRIDQQVKLRGFRIEPGEIEGVLKEHAAVAESVVIAREDAPGQRRLVGYVVPRENTIGVTAPAEQDWVAGITSQFETGYRAAVQEAGATTKDVAHDPTLSIYAWSGLEHTEHEVADWIEQIASRVLELKPQRLLEIGCGTGLVVTRLAPQVDEFWGTDLSQVAIDNLAGRIKAAGPAMRNVTLRRQLADDFAGIPEGHFDGVIINAVVEYFPSVDYLRRVVAGSLRALRPGGFVFIGDVPNLAAHELYHVGRELAAANDDAGLEERRRQVRRRLSEDTRLYLAPDFFRALARELPGIGQVEVRAIVGQFQHEATKLHADTHFDVVLHTVASAAQEIEWIDCKGDCHQFEEARRKLQEVRPAALGMANVPHARILARLRDTHEFWGQGMDNGAKAGASNACGMAGMAASAKLSQEPSANGSPSPEGLDVPWRVAENLPFRVHVMLAGSGGDGLCDLVFCRREDAHVAATVAEFRRERTLKPLGSYASNPLQARLAGRLVPQLREHLGRRVPDYMVPSAFVLLENLPRTPNGKLDRGALPAPDHGGDSAKDFIVPRTAAEESIARIWCEVLGVDRVAVDDNFFALGGHSLAATQVVARAREVFRVDLRVPRIFERPTVGGLAAEVESLLDEEITQLSEEEAKQLVNAT